MFFVLITCYILYFMLILLLGTFNTMHRVSPFFLITIYATNDWVNDNNLIYNTENTCFQHKCTVYHMWKTQLLSSKIVKKKKIILFLFNTVVMAIIRKVYIDVSYNPMHTLHSMISVTCSKQTEIINSLSFQVLHNNAICIIRYNNCW